MKKLIGAFVGAALGGLVSQAQAADKPDLSKFSANAVVQTLLEKVDAHAGRPQAKQYMNLNKSSLVCVGDIPAAIEAKDKNGRDVYMKPIVPDRVFFANNPDAKDKDAQTKIKTLLETRKDLAYLEFTTVMGPDAKQIGAYFKDILKQEPIDLYQGGTGFRDGSLRTTLLIDRKAIDQFASENIADIRKSDEKLLSTKTSSQPYTYSACGFKP